MPPGARVRPQSSTWSATPTVFSRVASSLLRPCAWPAAQHAKSVCRAEREERERRSRQEQPPQRPREAPPSPPRAERPAERPPAAPPSPPRQTELPLERPPALPPRQEQVPPESPPRAGEPPEGPGGTPPQSAAPRRPAEDAQLRRPAARRLAACRGRGAAGRRRRDRIPGILRAGRRPDDRGGRTDRDADAHVGADTDAGAYRLGTDPDSEPHPHSCGDAHGGARAHRDADGDGL